VNNHYYPGWAIILGIAHPIIAKDVIMKATMLLFLLLFTLSLTYSQDIFNNQQISQFNRSHFLFPLNLKIDAVTLDFDGDGKDDFLTQNYDDYQYFGKMNYIMLGFNNRMNVAPLSALYLDSHFCVIHHAIKDRDPFDRLVILTNEKAQLISYHNDPMIDYFDRYSFFDLDYNNNGLEDIYDVTIGHFTFNKNCVLMVVKRNGEIRIEFFQVFDEFFLRGHKRDIVSSYAINQIPRAVYSGKINDDDYDDVLFEMEDHWLIWLIHPDSISIIGSYMIPFPDKSIKTQSVLFHPTSDISLLVGLESLLDEDLAFVTIKNDGDDHHFNPVFQNGYLPNKRSIGSKMVFYQWKDSYTSIPILLIGNPYNNQLEDQNPYSVYTLTSSPEPELKLIQNIDFLPESIQEKNTIILNSPLTTGDFDGDQVTDLLFSCVTYTKDNPQDKFQNFLIINGQSQTTAINQQEWLQQN
jgi:hypothetical protein